MATGSKAGHRCVALLRGINVGKAKRVAMADLRALLEGLGHVDVRTLLNSGNAVFTVQGRAPAPSRLAADIQQAIASQLGVDCEVVVKTAADIAAVVAGHPLQGVATDPTRLLVALCGKPAAQAALQRIAAQSWGDERFVLTPHAAYVWCPHGILESPLGKALLKGLGDGGTTRNWATLLKIDALLQGEDAKA